MRLRAPKEKSKGDKGKEVPAAAAAASSSSSPVATQAGEEKDSDVVSPFTGESNKAAGETEQSPSSSAAAEKSPLESSQPQRPSDRVGMRDFLVFFFLDQRYPLVSTTDLRFCLKPAGKKTDEAPPAAAAAAAAASSSSSSPASDRSNLVVLQNTAERVGKRGELLRSQLEPKPLVSSPHQGGSRGDGERGNASAVNPLTSLSATDAAALSRRKSKLTATFGLPDQGVSSTGNGSVAQLAFQFGSSLGRLDSFDQQMDSEIVTDGMDCIRKVNICPPLNHGSSWAWDANRGVWDEPNPSSTWVEERYFGDEGLREGPRGYVSRYRNINSGLVTRKPPIEGCFSVDEYTGGEEIPRSDGSESEESSSDDE
uniref:Uncharacterized protein n=1 Tax=Chromera velia CCMP2878 TaxID=1169474 RepID=A0A0G4F2R0_9ALVE|eukprot:Cvel_14858.t1-p1 / transcript=Cvel_14858.t1 / gene=Cvel_14858 / organism=Chromera_velia_CCMP2878 / gene_product=hypothetical protein / transcript_product=hypothetical protein / location=Cvel_scaffold1074:5340-7025(+) / protein_length=368 / sequence_SO=supercontig / SO=protein_coding / is_pseudo=false